MAGYYGPFHAFQESRWEKKGRQRTQSAPNDRSHDVFHRRKRVNMSQLATQHTTHLCFIQEVKRPLHYNNFAFKLHVSVECPAGIGFILCHFECQLSNLHLLLIYFLKQSHKQP